MRYVYGLIGLAAGILVLKYTYPIRKFFGTDAGLDRIFAGLGGTYLFLKLFGLALVIASLFYIFKFF